jgi:hypothetical protein
MPSRGSDIGVLGRVGPPSDMGMSDPMSDPDKETASIRLYKRPGGSNIRMSDPMSNLLPTRVVLHSRSDVGPLSRPLKSVGAFPSPLRQEGLTADA